VESGPAGSGSVRLVSPPSWPSWWAPAETDAAELRSSWPSCLAQKGFLQRAALLRTGGGWPRGATGWRNEIAAETSAAAAAAAETTSGGGAVASGLVVVSVARLFVVTFVQFVIIVIIVIFVSELESVAAESAACWRRRDCVCENRGQSLGPAPRSAVWPAPR